MSIQHKFSVQFIALLLMALVGPAGAEKLSLWDCVDRAVRTHPVAESERWRVLACEARIETDRTSLRPSLRAGVHYSARSYVPEIPLSNRPLELGDHHDAGVGLEASYLLHDWDRRELQLEADRHARDAAVLGLEQSLELLAFEAGAGYIRLQAARRNLDLARTAVDVANKHMQDLEVMAEQGLATYEQVLEIRVRVEQSRVEVSRCEKELAVAVAELLQRLGMPLESEVEFAEEISGIPPAADRRSLQEVFSSRPGLNAYQAELSVLEARKAMAEAGDKPALRLFAGADYARPGIDQFRNEWITYGRIGIALDWEFFDWNRSNHRASEIDAERKAMVNRRNVHCQQVALEVKTADLESKEAARRVELARTAAEAAREHFKAVENRFAQGQATGTEFLDAQREETVSELELSLASYNLDLSLWRFAWASGWLAGEVARRWPGSRMITDFKSIEK